MVISLVDSLLNFKLILKILKNFTAYLKVFPSRNKINYKWICKHVTIGKYLSSIKKLCYETERNSQLAFFAGSSELDLNFLWKTLFDEELATHNKTPIIYITSNQIYTDLGRNNHHILNSNRYDYFKSPLTNRTEVSCC
ncbi:hypothetical protein GLOIN_2v1767412 [Rhizophagus clarus]|uniref:Uncharacterized protein n=1 Tax=Rhizophagus clarus TaxID=94130 RepID=A0A8H3M1G4_9GLOM|nr:hypothetical protein GLOIN_2v1767412 [Rhizophagus clarus]